MSRRFPYRLKAPDGFNELLENSANLHFFIVQENGPTCFIIKEEGSGKKYKVTIGDVQTCSCHSKDICCHILFVMIKVLRVPQDNPLIWQLSLVDSEVQQILQGRFRRVVESHPPVRKNTRQDDKPDDNKLTNEIPRKPIEDDEPCPICQEDMKDDINSTTWCKISCGNSMHIKCMIVWAEHRISLGENVTCPLCRADWGVNALRELKSIKTTNTNKKKKKNENNYNMYNIMCNSCHINPIFNSLFKCLFCNDYHLCLRCFQKDVHRIHPFIVQNGRGEPWKPALRNQTIPLSILELQNREISVEDYNNLLLLDAPPVSYHEYLVECLPKKHLVNEMKCLYCNTKMNINTDYHEISGCHHIFHDSCLIEIVRAGNECPLDHTVIFNGRKKKEKKKPVVDEKELFNSKPLEIDTKHSKSGKLVKIERNRNRRDNSSSQLPPSPFAIAGKNISINNNNNNTHSEVPPLPPLNGTQRNNKRINNSAPPSNTMNRDDDEEEDVRNDNHFNINTNQRNTKVKQNSIAEINLRRAKVAQRFLPQRHKKVQPDLNGLFIGKETSEDDYNIESDNDDDNNNNNNNIVIRNKMRTTKFQFDNRNNHNNKSKHFLQQSPPDTYNDLVIGSTPITIEEHNNNNNTRKRNKRNKDNNSNILSPPLPPQSPIINRNEEEEEEREEITTIGVEETNNNNNKLSLYRPIQPDFYTGLLTDNTVAVDPNIINESLIGSFVNLPTPPTNRNNRKRDIHSPIVQPIDFHTNIEANTSNTSIDIDSLQIGNTITNSDTTSNIQKSSKPIHLLGILNDNVKAVDPEITNFELRSESHLSPTYTRNISSSPLVQIQNTNTSSNEIKSDYPEHLIIGNSRNMLYNDKHNEENDDDDDDDDDEIENLIRRNVKLYKENGLLNDNVKDVDPEITNFELTSHSYTNPDSVNNRLLNRLYRYPSTST